MTATDSNGMRTDETIALEVKAPAVNAPVAASQSVTTDEDQAVSITLRGNGGTQYRIVNATQRGMLTGVAPNLVYTPNRDYNALFEGLDDGRLRHADHRFEWSRAEFAAWATRVAATYGYSANISPLGPLDETLGAPSQMAVFRRVDA